MRRKIDILILLIVLIVGVFAALNAQAIGDWWHSNQYQPSAEIQDLADNAGMNDIGKNLFYRFEPQIIDQQELNGFCNAEKLGCTEGRTIYLLKPMYQAEIERTIVTASHEMLHVAYSRLSDEEKADLEPLLDTELSKPKAVDIVKQLKDYPQEDYYNEAHSFIGSQLQDISTSLEQHYARYFSDRQKSAAAYFASPEN